MGGGGEVGRRPSAGVIVRWGGLGRARRRARMVRAERRRTSGAPVQETQVWSLSCSDQSRRAGSRG